MDKNTILTRVAATITTLAETNGSPESMLYLAFGADIHEWQVLRDILLKAGYVKISGNYVTLTTLGKVTADRLNKALSN